MTKCIVCNDDATEKHHVHPIHLGGKIDSMTQPLCGNCHTFIHTDAIRVYKGYSIKNRKEDWIRRAAPLINRIVQEMRNIEGGDNSASMVPIMFKVEKKLRDLAHRRKKELGFSNLTCYIIALIRKDCSF